MRIFTPNIIWDIKNYVTCFYLFNIFANYPQLFIILIFSNFYSILLLTLTPFWFLFFFLVQSVTQAKVYQTSVEIWRYQRYGMIVDFEERLPLPPPFTIFCYLYQLLRIIGRSVYAVLGQVLVKSSCSCCKNKKEPDLVRKKLVFFLPKYSLHALEIYLLIKLIVVSLPCQVWERKVD